MVDPLSLAAGIAGLSSLTIQILQIIAKYNDDVRTADQDVKALVEELTALSQVLKMLKTAWKEKKLPPNFDLSALAGIEKACSEQLRSLLDQLTHSTRWVQRYSLYVSYFVMALIHDL